MWKQINFGPLVLAVAEANHIAILITALEIRLRLGGDMHPGWPLILDTFAAILLAHTIQVGICAVALTAIAIL